MNDLLPLGSRKIKCKEERCRTQISTKCSRCKNQEETLDHIIKGNCYRQEWDTINTNLKKKFIKEVLSS